jgi:hypothetical protein
MAAPLVPLSADVAPSMATRLGAAWVGGGIPMVLGQSGAQLLDYDSKSRHGEGSIQSPVKQLADDFSTFLSRRPQPGETGLESWAASFHDSPFTGGMNLQNPLSGMLPGWQIFLTNSRFAAPLAQGPIQRLYQFVSPAEATTLAQSYRQLAFYGTTLNIPQTLAAGWVTRGNDALNRVLPSGWNVRPDLGIPSVINGIFDSQEKTGALDVAEKTQDRKLFQDVVSVFKAHPNISQDITFAKAWEKLSVAERAKLADLDPAKREQMPPDFQKFIDLPLRETKTVHAIDWESPQSPITMWRDQMDRVKKTEQLFPTTAPATEIRTPSEPAPAQPPAPAAERTGASVSDRKEEAPAAVPQPPVRQEQPAQLAPIEPPKVEKKPADLKPDLQAAPVPVPPPPAPAPAPPPTGEEGKPAKAAPIQDLGVD